MAKRRTARSPRRVVHRTPSNHPEARKLQSPTKAKGWARLHPKNIWAAVSSKKGLRIIAATFAVLFLVFIAIFLWIAKDLPSPNKINSKISAQTTKLYDRTGQNVLVEIYGDKNRSVV